MRAKTTEKCNFNSIHNCRLRFIKVHKCFGNNQYSGRVYRNAFHILIRSYFRIISLGFDVEYEKEKINSRWDFFGTKYVDITKIILPSVFH